MYWLKTFTDLVGIKDSLRAYSGRELDKKAVQDYLTMRYTMAPNTILKGVHKINTGMGPATGENELARMLLEVKPKEPFAMLTSGGVDSSLLARLYDGPNVHHIFIQTLIGKERPYFDILAKTLKGKVHIVTLTDDDFLKMAGEIYDRIDEPVGDAAIVSVYAGAKHAKSLGLDTLVTGEGGDECFGGYWLYPEFKKCDEKKVLPEMALIQRHIGLAFGRIPYEVAAYWKACPVGQSTFWAMNWDRRMGYENLFVWKNIRGAQLAGIDCLMPYGLGQVEEFAKRVWSQAPEWIVDVHNQREDCRTKLYLKNLAKEWGVPAACVERTKMGFASEASKKVMDLMRLEVGLDDRPLGHSEVFAIWSLARWCKSVGIKFDWRQYI